VHTVRVSAKGAARVASGHPWIFSSDVVDTGGAPGGAAVEVADHHGRTLGVAHFSSASQIALRMLSSAAGEIGREFFLRRLRDAADFRRRVVEGSEAYRLVFGEGDLLPALVVDRYGDYLVVQTLNQGMDCRRELILDCLQELCSPAGIVLRNDAPVRAKENLPLEAAVARGEVPSTVRVRMNGLVLQADLLRGQKTGVYLDQRENYLAAARYARGRTLDCFTSTGGFALHAAPRSDTVEAVDSSTAALAAARANADANGIANIDFREADVFQLLSAYASARRRFSTVVLDPPAFAKSRRSVEGAVRGYRDINTRALRLLEPGGILVTCSCSHHMSEAMLLEVLAEASLDAGRRLRVLERRTQAQDHPILLTVPETHYLKCLILEVMP
jgi:23S rRNA (cytosine1962-C5)-methyltransferase